ncbi:sensor histidine kinase [Paenibacillus periandrae]|uniref:sensor histidine kinase n=1 Tax=Paenibacillus periandrae TaxID=1761741 RepID=UPI001F08F77D|nr:HAMP domain-containing sensor histidine kinase [Paenibacillus periandrae]
MGNKRLRYRFTFFQRQFMSHMLVSILILALMGAGFVYYLKQQSYAHVTEELSNAGKVIVRLLTREEEEPTVPLQAYRGLLAERKISFIIFDKTGEIAYRDPKMSAALRNKAFLDGLRARVMFIKDNQTFIVDRSPEQPLVVLTKPIHPKSKTTDMYMFIFSPVVGYKDILLSMDRNVGYAAALIFVITALISAFISRRISRRLQLLRQATCKLADGHYSIRLPINRSDELGDLALDFNAMAVQLEASSLQLKQYELRRHSFMTDVSHELRTPLTSIRGIIEGLKNNLVTEPEDKHKYYAIIEKETFRLIRLINELLDMEKIENGLITLAKKNSPLREIMETVVETLEVLIEAKKLQIIIECDPDLVVYCDYDRLTQILINLIKNSIQFTEYGTIRLTAAETEASTLIDITDTGRGMTSAELALIWDRFYKADPSRAKSSSETGLGLSIVKQLVEAHGGTIEASSTPGIGSSFVITLPKLES